MADADFWEAIGTPDAAGEALAAADFRGLRLAVPRNFLIDVRDPLPAIVYNRDSGADFARDGVIVAMDLETNTVYANEVSSRPESTPSASRDPSRAFHPTDLRETLHLPSASTTYVVTAILRDR